MGNLNFISLWDRIRLLYRRYRWWCYVSLLVGIILPVAMWCLGIYYAFQNTALEADYDILREEQARIWGEEQKQIAIKEALLQKVPKKRWDGALLVHILDLGNDLPLQLESFEIERDNYVIKGISKDHESISAYVGRLRGVMKGATIHEKQGVVESSQVLGFTITIRHKEQSRDGEESTPSRE